MVLLLVLFRKPSVKPHSACPHDKLKRIDIDVIRTGSNTKNQAKETPHGAGFLWSFRTLT
jgi:hypothetical protein